MELRQLRAFVSVAELEHFHRAAEQLRIAQPILSRRIKALEDELGTALFERLPRGVRLTAAGGALLVDARALLAGIDAAADRACRVARGEAGRLRVTFTEAGSFHGIFPDTVRAFREAHPTVTLTLQALNSAAQQRGLQAGEFDVGFLYQLDDVAPDLDRRVVQEDTVMLALPASHRLAARETIWLRDLLEEPFVWNTPSTNPRYDNALMAACLRKGLAPRVVQEVSNSATVLSLVAVGFGVGFVPGIIRWRMHEGLLLRPVADLLMPYRTEIAWRRDNPSPLLARFVALALSMSKVAGSKVAGSKVAGSKVAGSKVARG
jgi:DNA-binding transcriptional LysR family regulator